MKRHGTIEKLMYIHMKRSLLLAIILTCCSVAFAQNELMVHSSDKGLYLLHTVAPKENFYSIGRLYNIYPKDIESFNSLDMNKGLAIGQLIKIPLNTTNFTQTSDKGRAVYYEVGEKEGLYRVSVKNNNVLMANLRKWNHLATDNIYAGKKLVVGYLVSPEANNIIQQPVVSTVEKKQTETASNQGALEEEVKTKKEEPKTPVNKPEPPATSTQNTAAVNAVIDANGGYFKPLFDRQVKAQPAKTNEPATAGIFKTASGWQDAKYYALMDNVEPGTIVRIINPTNNKAVYAKVLGEMSGIRQNQGYNIRMSNAAANALEVSDTEKFIVRVNY